jgi:hypothetical protein
MTKMKITSIESYADFVIRCKNLHKRMLELKELGNDELIMIESLIYAYAKALYERDKYEQLPLVEKKRLHEEGLEAQRKILEFASEIKRPIFKYDMLDVDKALK